MLKDVSTLTPEDFEAFVGATFSVIVNDSLSIPLTLASVDCGEPAGTPELLPPGVRSQPFSLVFTGPKELPLEQGTIACTHETFGDLVCFIVPISPDASVRRYEAVFG